jgi:hypothetical protein
MSTDVLVQGKDGRTYQGNGEDYRGPARLAWQAGFMLYARTRSARDIAVLPLSAAMTAAARRYGDQDDLAECFVDGWKSAMFIDDHQRYRDECLKHIPPAPKQELPDDAD